MGLGTKVVAGVATASLVAGSEATLAVTVASTSGASPPQEMAAEMINITRTNRAPRFIAFYRPLFITLPYSNDGCCKNTQEISSKLGLPLAPIPQEGARQLD